MKKLTLIICIVSAVFFACSDKDKLPEEILPQQKMEAVMWDMIRAGEFLDGYIFSKDTVLDKTAESLKWYDKVYQLHGVTKEEFIKSYHYYKEHPLLMKALADSLDKKDNNWADTAGQSKQLPADTANTRPGLIKSGDSMRGVFFDSLKRIRRPVDIQVR